MCQLLRVCVCVGVVALSAFLYASAIWGVSEGEYILGYFGMRVWGGVLSRLLWNACVGGGIALSATLECVRGGDCTPGYFGRVRASGDCILGSATLDACVW